MTDKTSEIEVRVKKIVGEQLGVKDEEITSDASFVDDLGADSLDTVELVMALEEEFETHFGVAASSIKTKIRYVEHHRSHLGSAFFPSPFDEAAILSIDGSGDFTTTMIGVGKGSEIKVLDSVNFPVSCGIFYTAFTQFLGFPHYGDV